MCTLYVGKIPEGLDDATMSEVLSTCGAVSKWKRSVDPTSGKPKGFGFCDYSTGEGVLRALRLLKHFRPRGDAAELLLKVDQKTEEFLASYEPARTAALGYQKEAAASKAAAQGAPPPEMIGSDAEADPPLVDKLAALSQELSQEWRIAQGGGVSPGGGVSKGGGEGGGASSADGASEGLTPEAAAAAAEQAAADAAAAAKVDAERERVEKREREKEEARAAEREERARREEREQRERERDERIRDKEREERRRAREIDDEYRERERQWERREIEQVS